MYTPDLKNDGHNTNVLYASAWLKSFLPQFLADSQKMKRTLFVLTFDENGGTSGNVIYTALVGSTVVKSGIVNSTGYNHYSMLRTIEDNFNLGSLGRQDATATSIQNVWSTTGSVNLDSDQ